MSDLAFLDLETTGLDPARHEIIEAAVVRVDGRTLEELDAVEVLAWLAARGLVQVDARVREEAPTP